MSVQQIANPPTSNLPFEIICILDRSGSMEGLAKDVIGGFNTFLSEQKTKQKQNPVLFTLVQFDTEYDVLVKDVNLQDVQPLTSDVYVPRGGTALYDAIGRTLAERKPNGPVNRVVVIVTDGDENSSKEYSFEKVKQMITEQEKAGAKISYLSSDLKAVSTAKALNIGSFTNNVGAVRSVSAYAATSQGMAEAFSLCDMTCSSYVPPTTNRALTASELAKLNAQVATKP